jgi:nucleotide-binding universal stress UspA family protein
VERQWIVGIDASDDARAALRWAAMHAPGRADEVVALTTYHVPVALSLMMAKRAFDVDRLGIEATAGHDVDVALEELGVVREEGAAAGQALGVRYVTEVVEGHPGATLVERASHADLLVVGQQGDGGPHPHVMLGSVSRYCSTHAVAPVVVVPPDPPARECRRVVVGYDGSTNADRALAWALAFAPPDATVKAIIALEMTPWLEDDLVRARFPEEIDRETERLSGRLSELTDDPRLEREVVLQDARDAIVEASASTDLLVLGARGHGTIAAALLGSVTTWVLHHAPCPVAVIPQPEVAG